ncbi:MAG: fumarate hydratase C-terminal domain-containing protein [Nitrospirae bacterium]|nr:fumarate hydratase C-terminal domain-containing protein [Nitrospirota bacterium]
MVRTVSLRTPLTTEDVLSLKAGDIVSISGSMVTGRDRVHKFLVEQRPPKEDIPFDLAGTILYHCGPLMKKGQEGYSAVSAGPTTSMRVEMYEADVIGRYKIKGVMGKGGMGERTRQALKENACVYFHAIGGAAVYLADRIKKTLGVWRLEEFGPTEAMWCFEVEDFPAIVTMDVHGNDMHKGIEDLSAQRFLELIRK